MQLHKCDVLDNLIAEECLHLEETLVVIETVHVSRSKVQVVQRQRSYDVEVQLSGVLKKLHKVWVMRSGSVNG